jgi:hypothetical protein
MPLPSSGNQISMSQIAAEKQGYGAGSGQYFQNITLLGLSRDDINDFQFYNGDSLLTLNIPGTPDANQPYGMAEFHGYSQSFWPSSAPGSISTNATHIMDINATEESGNDCTAATTLQMTLNTTNKTLAWKFVSSTFNTSVDNSSDDQTHTTNTNTISYNGTITSLEARMVWTGADISGSGGGAGYTSPSMAGRVWAAHSTTSLIDASDLTNNGGSGLTGTKTKISGNDGSSATNQNGSYGYKTMRTTSGDCSMGIFSTCDDVGNTTNNYSNSRIDFDGSGSGIYWQIRANGSETLTIYNATYNGSDVLAQTANSAVQDTS